MKKENCPCFVNARELGQCSARELGVFFIMTSFVLTYLFSEPSLFPPDFPVAPYTCCLNGGGERHERDTKAVGVRPSSLLALPIKNSDSKFETRSINEIHSADHLMGPCVISTAFRSPDADLQIKDMPTCDRKFEKIHCTVLICLPRRMSSLKGS